MRRPIWPWFLLLALGLLVLPADRHRHTDQTHRIEGNLTPQREMAMKEAIYRNDVQLTDELCRNQCVADFHKTLTKIDQRKNVGSYAEFKQVLQNTHAEHPHILELVWQSTAAGQAPEVVVNTADPKVHAQAAPLLEQARQAAQNGQTYQSPRLDVDGQAYFVLGVPTQDQSSYLIGIVHQDILNRVADHQIKNLRIATYPPDHNFKIESVDSDTLRDKQVNNPEQNEGTSHYHKNEVVVKFRNPPTDAELQKIDADIQATAAHIMGTTYVFRSSSLEAKQLMEYFQHWDIEYAEPHFLYLTNQVPAASVGNETNAQTIVPNDLLYRRYQWNLPIIDTELGWNISKGASNVVVGIVDTGVDLNHPDLQGHLLKGINVIDNSALPLDDVGHGTHVAGVITALVNNDRGVAGMTWENPVLPVKVLDETGAGSTYAVAQGVVWATDHGAKVLNLSLGNYADANFLHDAIRYAFDHDVVLIAASGNDNTEQPGYPAAYPEVLAVAATDSNKQRAPFSNFGDYIGVAAPGVNIASTYPDNQYAALSGTSMASPHVTALAALIRSINPALKNTEVMDIIRKTAMDLGTPGRDKYFGYGQIDVVKALQAAKNGLGAPTPGTTPGTVNGETGSNGGTTGETPSTGKGNEGSAAQTGSTEDTFDSDDSSSWLDWLYRWFGR
jgi:subtilisin family serine protease